MKKTYFNVLPNKFHTKYILYIALMSANIVAIRKIEKTLRPLSHQEVLLIFCQYRCRYRFHSRSSPHNMLENIAGGYRLSCRNIYSIDNFNAIWCANYPRAICLFLHFAESRPNPIKCVFEGEEKMTQ